MDRRRRHHRQGAALRQLVRGDGRRHLAETRSCSATSGYPRHAVEQPAAVGRHRRRRRAAAPAGTSDAGRPGLWSGRLRARGRRSHGASLIGVDFSVEAIRQADQYADSLGRDAGSSSPTSPPRACPRLGGRRDVHRRRPHRLRAGRHVRRAPPDAPARRAGGQQLGGAGPRRRHPAGVGPPGRLRPWFAAAGFVDIAVVERPAVGAAGTGAVRRGGHARPGRDDAVASLRDEAIEELPHVPRTRGCSHRRPPPSRLRLDRAGCARFVNLRILGVRRPRFGPTGRSCRTDPA